MNNIIVMTRIMIAISFVGVCLGAYCQDFRPSNTSYIEIRHTGESEINMPSIFISMKRIHFPLQKIDTVGANFRGKLTPELTDIYLRYKYQNIVTDPKTFNILKHHLRDKAQQKFFATKMSDNYGVFDDYEITVEGKIYHVYYKYLQIFFTILVDKLSNQKCDPIVIEKLKFYRIKQYK